MAGKIDVQALLDSVDLIDVIERNGVQLHKQGGEFVGLCPFHDDTKPSLKANQRKQLFKCNGCNVGGNAIDFLRNLNKSLTFVDAVKALQGITGVTPDGEKREVVKRAKLPEWKSIVPVPADAPTPTFKHWEYGPPSATWKYTDQFGSTVSYAVRFDKDGAGKPLLDKGGDPRKEVLPYCYATNGQREEWRWLGLPPGRPLYNLRDIVQNTQMNVIVVEGEKCAKILQEAIPKMLVTTWIGGSRALHLTDWTPLKGRRVILWGDNDRPGVEAMCGRAEVPAEGNKKAEPAQPGVAQILKEIGVLELHYVHPPADSPKGWDGADGNFNWESAKIFLRTSVFPHPPKVPVFAEPIKNLPPISPPPVKGPPIAEPTVPISADASMHPFLLLGTRKDGDTQKFCFFVHSSKLVIELAASQFSKANLITLAPLNWWENRFPGSRGIDTDSAIDWLISECNKIGIFSDRYLRGRGAWRDGKNTVLHVGNYLVMNGVPTALGASKTKFIYEAGEPLHIGLNNPLTNKEASKFLSVVKLLNWEREINAYLLAGWCVIAPICGALKWRPHIWITGAAGTGKSWCFLNIVRRMLDETALAVQGETSEAGLRQLLNHDALPVVFDEAEGEDRRASERMDAVMSLMRAASADDGGVMAKGSSSGSSKTYKVRACFAFASIAVQIKQQSDRTRVTVLGIVKRSVLDRAARWQALQKMYAETITDGYVKGLQARTVRLLPVILENSVMFSAAAASVLGDQRIGDQLGAMLAGAYSLHSDKVITYEAAVEWIKARDWSEERGLERTRDEVALFGHIMEHMVRVEGTGAVDRNIGELCLTASQITADPVVEPQHAASRLGRFGIKVEKQGDMWFILISSSSPAIKALLRDTAWGKSHARILLRLDAAEQVDTARFASGVRTRAVRLPISHLTG